MTSNVPPIIAIAERILNKEKLRLEIEEEIKDIYHEAKSAGYDSKVLKRAIRYISMDEKGQKRFKSENDMFALYVDQLALPL